MQSDTFIKYLPTIPDLINKAARYPIRYSVPKILAELKGRSPVDTGKYRESWNVNISAPSGLLLESVVFSNEDFRSRLFERGAGVGMVPWYYPGVGQDRVKKTGKLKVAKGRVWAGGLNPGHALTVGGAIDPVFYTNKRRQNEFAREIATKVIERLKQSR